MESRIPKLIGSLDRHIYQIRIGKWRIFSDAEDRSTALNILVAIIVTIVTFYRIGLLH
jgi:hypothetical protein